MASSSAGQKSLEKTLGDGQHIIALVNRSHSLPTDDTISYGFKSQSNRPWEGSFSLQRDPYLKLPGAKFDHNNGSIDIETVASGMQRALPRKPDTNGILIRTRGVPSASAYDERIT